MNEQEASGIMACVADYLNLSTLDPEAMHAWIYKQLGCEPGEYDAEDRQVINFVFALLCAAPVSHGGKLYKVSGEAKLPEVKVRPCFGKDREFIIEPGINGLLFVIRQAVSATNLSRGGQCELCLRSFFATRKGAKYCCSSCRVKASEIRTGKREWKTELYFFHGLKQREMKILQEANDGR